MRRSVPCGAILAAWLASAAGATSDDIHRVAGEGDADAVLRLLDEGVSPNARRPGEETPLHRAARGARHETVAVLLERGADPGLRDAKGETPLHEASSAPPVPAPGRRADEVARLLIAARADIHAVD